MAYCVWDNGYLPTNAEYNYVASGGDEQRAYPWSSPAGSVAIDCTDAAYKDTPQTCNNASPVGSKPAGDGRWGHSDVSGDVIDWVLDYRLGFPNMTYIDPCVDCAQLMPDPNFEQRVVRGGWFDDASVGLRSASEYDIGRMPTLFAAEMGFRCAGPP